MASSHSHGFKVDLPDGFFPAEVVAISDDKVILREANRKHNFVIVDMTSMSCVRYSYHNDTIDWPNERDFDSVRYVSRGFNADFGINPERRFVRIGNYIVDDAMTERDHSILLRYDENTNSPTVLKSSFSKTFYKSLVPLNATHYIYRSEGGVSGFLQKELSSSFSLDYSPESYFAEAFISQKIVPEANTVVTLCDFGNKINVRKFDEKNPCTNSVVYSATVETPIYQVLKTKNGDLLFLHNNFKSPSTLTCTYTRFNIDSKQSASFSLDNLPPIVEGITREEDGMVIFAAEEKVPKTNAIYTPKKARKSASAPTENPKHVPTESKFHLFCLNVNAGLYTEVATTPLQQFALLGRNRIAYVDYDQKNQSSLVVATVTDPAQIKVSMLNSLTNVLAGSIYVKELVSLINEYVCPTIYSVRMWEKPIAINIEEPKSVKKQCVLM